MEIIGIILLCAVFGLGIFFVYIFLRYIELLKSVRALNQLISNRLSAIEEKLGMSSSQKEQTLIAQSDPGKKQA